MAKIDYEGAPAVQPESSRPDDYVRVQANPEAFGTNIGEGVSKLGSGGLDLSEFYGKTAADQATNNTLQQVTDVLNGDPSKTVPGPDGKPVQDTGYYGLRGGAAMQAREQVTQNIDEIIRENGENLSTPAARLEYETETRRYRAQWMERMGAHADQQQRVWMADTNTNTANININGAARHPFDDAVAADALEKVRDAYVKNAQINGESTDAAILKADQDTLLARIRSGIVVNPTRTKQLLDSQGSILASRPDYDQIAHSVKEADVNAQLMPMVDQHLGDALGQASAATHGGTAAGGFDNAWNFTLSHEGGYSPKDANGQPVKYGINQSAHPGVDIKNLTPEGAKGIARQYWNASGAENLPPALGQVHFDTYYINPGEATKLLQESGGDPQKYLQLRETWLNGLVQKDPAKFGRYEKAWTTRNNDLQAVVSQGGQSQGATSTADNLRLNRQNILEGVQSDAEARFGTQYPDAVERTVQTASRRLDQAISQQDQQYEVASHIVQGAMVSDHAPTSEAELIALGPQVSNAWKTMQLVNPYGARAVENMFDANAKGKSVSYGANFSAMVSRVLAPVGDPGRITNPSQTWPYVTGGENGALTNSGAAALGDLMQFRSGKDGEAASAQLRSFLNTAKGEFSFANDAAGVRDPNGDRLYDNFLRQALPAFMQADPATRQRMLDPKGPDFLGKMMAPRTPAQRLKDFMHDVPETGQGAALLASFQTMHGTADRQQALKDAVANGTISREEGTRIGIEMGYIGQNVSRGTNTAPVPPKTVNSGPEVPAASFSQ